MGILIIVGEFGTTDAANATDRINWTEAVRVMCDKYGFIYSYFHLSGGMGNMI